MLDQSSIVATLLKMHVFLPRTLQRIVVPRGVFSLYASPRSTELDRIGAENGVGGSLSPRCDDRAQSRQLDTCQSSNATILEFHLSPPRSKNRPFAGRSRTEPTKRARGGQYFFPSAKSSEISRPHSPRVSSSTYKKTFSEGFCRFSCQNYCLLQQPLQKFLLFLHPF